MGEGVGFGDHPERDPECLLGGPELGVGGWGGVAQRP